MNDRVDVLTGDLDQVTSEVEAAFGRLSHSQLNWKPSADRWSIAQCLDHLVTINRLYFPLLASLRSGAPSPGFWERHSPFSGLLGRLLIKTLSPENRKKTKTSAKAEPSTSEIDGIIERFVRHQAELIAHIRDIPRSVDRTRTIVTSPLLSWVTYSLDDCLTILVVHEKRHVLQARRVMEDVAFPKSVRADASENLH